ncbi:NAD(P)H-dependent oxidoreductase [Canibacter zhuwentaonis]|uniref:NAD(P)H-dependent oxidoreductase n=1 Tax=Canibacter zhuwentaonis TaxID=2837491 RepID=UPI002111F981|nr:NAD(P)H-dependent oxidoreductase [Canibacter zhuwentaonis]
MADGLIVITLVFQGSISGLLKLFFDLLPPVTLSGKAVTLGATGGFARHALLLESVLRSFISYLHRITVSIRVYGAKPEWESDFERITSRARRAGGELARWTQLLQCHNTDVTASWLAC